ncbi:MAG: type I DNA topoisomerase [bacterium]|nr:type I DNA topoisomerase [bacterium]
MNLVIVESPTKAKTLARFLGDEYTIEASYGHVRDLPKSKLGVKITKGKFTPDYVQTKKQADRVKEIKKLSVKAKQIYLATDPDREGEAIAWHMSEIFDNKADAKTKRIVFHQITEKAIQHALEKPRDIDMNLVDAQQARRILDRLVGYKLSPLLWKKVRKGLSAGRVQSVALRLIVEKEREIAAFKAEEYWDVLVTLQKNAPTDQLTVKLVQINGQEAEVTNQTKAEEVEKELTTAGYLVESVEKKEFSRTPPAPFTTSTLQQIAANKLGWSAKKTMQMAQNLYEEGYITYHRTDSTNLAEEATAEAKDYISKSFGASYALDKARAYQTKSKVAQEAHEAIRPTNVATADLPAESLRDHQKLYELIWKRFVACQTAEATGETLTITVQAKAKDEYLLSVKGETIKFDGWYKVWGKAEDVEENVLPEVTAKEKLDFVNLVKTQKFTQPPARYNDASLIKTLEEKGIGRPSTYAPIISTILERLYVEKIDKRFQPTTLGIAVCDFLVTNFADIVDYDFTAQMEDQLDEIADGKRKWQPTLADFYDPFAKKLDMVAETAEKVKIEVEETGNPCPKCGEGKEVIRLGRFGKFLACSRFPDCDYKANYINKTGQKCPKCGDGDVIVKRTRTGKTFFGCSNYPKCDFASWTKPKITALESGVENNTPI